MLSSYTIAMSTRDNIPRVTHLVQFEAILDGLAEGLCFDELRKRLRRVAIDLARVSGGHEPGGHPDYQMWNPTTDALADLMRWGWVGKAALPSSRDRVGAYRTVLYGLTGEGRQWTQNRNAGEARDALGRKLIEQHPYFRQYLIRLNKAPLFIPELAESDIDSRATPETLDYLRVVKEVFRRIEASPVRPIGSAVELQKQVSMYVRRRFAHVQPKNRKALLDALLDAVLAGVLEAEGLGADPASFVIINSWARELFLTGSSRYVNEAPGGWLHWSGADICVDGSVLSYTRRGLNRTREAVVQMLGIAANELKQPGTELVRIYPLRGTVAFRCGAVNEIVDRVIVELITNQNDSPYRLSLSAGALFTPPGSEWPLSFNGRKYHLITIRNVEK